MNKKNRRDELSLKKDLDDRYARMTKDNEELIKRQIAENVRKYFF